MKIKETKERECCTEADLKTIHGSPMRGTKAQYVFCVHCGTHYERASDKGPYDPAAGWVIRSFPMPWEPARQDDKTYQEALRKSLTEIAKEAPEQRLPGALPYQDIDPKELWKQLRDLQRRFDQERSQRQYVQPYPSPGLPGLPVPYGVPDPLWTNPKFVD